MKKLLFALMIGMTAGLVMAQGTVMVEKQQADLAVTGDIGLYSAYVWRGLVLNDSLVAQPSLNVGKGPFSLNIWANYDIDGRDGQPDSDFTQTNFKLAYAIPVDTDAFNIDAGVIHYTYPDSRTAGDTDTTELFISSTFKHIILTPVVSIYGDVGKADGCYASLALSQGFEISDALTAAVGGSIGMGEGGYNSYYFGSGNSSGLTDYNVYISASYAVTENLSLGAKLAYSMLDGAYGHDAEAGRGAACVGTDNTIWGGLSLSYKF